MSSFRLYRKIYLINTSEVYSLLNPFSISANTYNLSSSQSIEIPTVQQESTGVYYVDLDVNLYNPTDIYQLNWQVQYTSNPISNKRLETIFKIAEFVFNTYISDVKSDITYIMERPNIDYLINQESIVITINKDE